MRTLNTATMLIFRGVLFGIAWSIVYFFILLMSGIDVPFVHALLYGILLGTLLSIVNVTLLMFIGSKGRYALKSNAVSTVIMMVLIFITFMFLSPTLILFFVNVLAVSAVYVYLTKTTLSERREQ
jgi:hypothetical protein